MFKTRVVKMCCIPQGVVAIAHGRGWKVCKTIISAKTAYQPPLAPVSKTNSATIAELPRPCWKKTPDDDLFALITGISHWRQSEVKR